LQADLAWRRKHRIEERSGEDADAVLGCEVAKLKAFLPHENPPCLDRRGRPVIIKHFGHVYFSRLLNSTNITLDQLCDYNWCAPPPLPTPCPPSTRPKTGPIAGAA